MNRRFAPAMAFALTMAALAGSSARGAEVESARSPSPTPPTPEHRTRYGNSGPVQASRPAFSRRGKQLSRGARKYGRAR